MKRLSPLLIISSIILFGSSSVIGQPPPPPRVHVSNSNNVKSFLFSSPDGGFSVDFPAKPTVTAVEKPSSFGKMVLTTVTHSTMFAFYAVVFIDFPTVMDDRYDLNARFDMMRESEAKRLGARVAKDSEFFFGSHYGRELSFETPKETVSTRVIAVGPRIYQLTIGTKGRLTTQSEVLRKSNQTRIDNFFNSFKISKVMQAREAVAELPSDFQVTTANGRFQSSFLGISMAEPLQWTLLKEEESALLMELGKEIIKQSDRALADRLTDQNTRVLAMYSKTGAEEGVTDAVMILMAEKAPYPSFLPSAVAKTFIQMYLDKDEKVTSPPADAKLGDINFSWVETYNTTDKNYHRLYFSNVKGISFELSISYKDPKDLRTMLKAAETLKVVTE